MSFIIITKIINSFQKMKEHFFYEYCTFLDSQVRIFFYLKSIFGYFDFSLSLAIHSFFLPPDVLCNPTDVIWRWETPFEAMTGRIASSSWVFRDFPQSYHLPFINRQTWQSGQVAFGYSSPRSPWLYGQQIITFSDWHILLLKLDTVSARRRTKNDNGIWGASLFSEHLSCSWKTQKE